MGSGESTTRKVSFGVDDEDRVRILRGVKLSEDVLQRMRGVANIAPDRPTSPASPTSSPQKDTGASRSASSSPPPQQSPKKQAQPGSQPGPQPGPQPSPQPGPQPGPQPSPQPSSSKPASYAKEEQKRYERQQAALKAEQAKVEKREKDSAREEMTKALMQKRMEAEHAQKLAQQLQKKDAQLKALDAFYKEQMAQLEKRNSEKYIQSKEEFHSAASKTEANVRSRNMNPVCSGLQAQILSCYRDNGDQTLRCSDLAKQYMQCINAAKKNLLVNHG
ncbi:MICOS complex subunit mic25a isoform X2 [Gymnodraco acuticeps]|uniref:MICOS complex subunit mic25a isoform X2 n=1 Tax=Gymnodraco acuticeps TaxID=8218 RepID=A0A6P8SPZ9_GYMAC|nr:MICOS complex subunit mic25a isoform X2 [Gymnodraco acuticeps]